MRRLNASEQRRSDEASKERIKIAAMLVFAVLATIVAIAADIEYRKAIVKDAIQELESEP